MGSLCLKGPGLSVLMSPTLSTAYMLQRGARGPLLPSDTCKWRQDSLLAPSPPVSPSLLSLSALSTSFLSRGWIREEWPASHLLPCRWLWTVTCALWGDHSAPWTATRPPPSPPSLTSVDPVVTLPSCTQQLRASVFGSLALHHTSLRSRQCPSQWSTVTLSSEDLRFVTCNGFDIVACPVQRIPLKHTAGAADVTRSVNNRQAGTQPCGSFPAFWRWKRKNQVQGHLWLHRESGAAWTTGDSIANRQNKIPPVFGPDLFC